MGRFKKFKKPAGISFVWEASDKKELDDYCHENKLGQNQVLLTAFKKMMQEIKS